MMGEDPGWYHDPAPANRTWPTTVRYWDGKNWSARVKQASRAQRKEWQEEESVARIAEARMAAAAGTGVQVAGRAAVVLETSRDFTPDGARLAAWWIRVGATVVDAVITTVLVLLFSWRYIRQVGAAFGAYVDSAAQASQSGSVAPDPSGLTSQLTGAIIGIAMVSTLVQLVYQVGFLKGFQATPGKLLLGLEVRLRERPGVLSWRTVLAHWAAAKGYAVLQVVPIIGAVVVSVYWLLDVLWPLWDGNRQALHDKVARTNVVRR